MSHPDRLLWVQRLDGNGLYGIWAVSLTGPEVVAAAKTQQWIAASRSMMTARAEIASVSVVPSGSALARSLPAAKVSGFVHARVAALPLCFLNGRVADLIGIDATHDGQYVARRQFQDWIESATLKGLVHQWLLAETDGQADWSPVAVPEVRGSDRAAIVSERAPDHSVAYGKSISLGIDAAWLLGGESGAQVFVFEMLRELARRDDIDRIVMLSDSGVVPEALNGVKKVQGKSWAAALSDPGPTLDILHRPYQPWFDVDYVRYRRVAHVVALTVLDFIAYDNPAYHESRTAWREYQELFDEKVRLADRVFAISRYIGSRIERQFAHQLTAPVKAIHPGTDHLLATAAQPVIQVTSLPDLAAGQFLLVLGNDFEHKNRDFAVKVFGDMCRRGYEGHLALVGYHLDAGSTFSRELQGAEAYSDRIHRTGPVSGEEKGALLRAADVVLYPTSNEGFGLVPFEAACLGTPTAFVNFGALRETLSEVSSCDGWQVGAFADHVFALIAAPAGQVAQLRRIIETMTWRRSVDQVIATYREMLSSDAHWKSAQVEPRMVGSWEKLLAHRQIRRIARVARRLAGTKPR